MEHRQKVDHLLNDMQQRGIGKFTTAPPLYRVLWGMGLQTTPPHFASFGSLALITGLTFGVLLWALTWFLWREPGMPLAISIVTAALAGVLFGLVMAAYYRHKARRLGLPRWEDYPQAGVGSNPRP